MLFSSKRCFSFGIIFLTFTLLSACNSPNRTEKKLKQDTKVTTIEGTLVFKNVTLDQADEKGRPLWKVKAKQATYTKDKKTAQIEKPTGDLFQDGQIVLQVAAETGEVQIRETGNKIFLKGQISATDIRNKAVFRGDELEWSPKEDLLIVRNNLKGNHPQLQATAKEARYFTRTQQVELSGQVTALAKDPDFQMKTEHLLWQIKAQQANSDKRIQIERYKIKTVTDRVEADQSQINLKTKIATLKQNIQLTSIEPPVLMSSNSAIWNINARTVVSDQPIKIVQQVENLVITANQGQIDLEKKVANLSGGVQGINNKNQANLYANQMTWEIPTQKIQASGNVIYKQVNPPFNVSGPTAVGKLQDQSIVVNSEPGKRVVTEIIP
jgi:LPS export ABC transporter protein LptC